MLYYFRTAAVSALIAGPALCWGQENWVKLSSTDEYNYEARAGSFERSVTEKTETPIVSMLIRSYNIKKKQYEFDKAYVRLTACEDGYGKLVTTGLDGRYKYDNDFVIDGGTVASKMAGILCLMAKSDKDAVVPSVSPSRKF